MTDKLRLSITALVKGICGFAIMGALLFISAGSLAFINGWLFLITLALLMFIMFAVLIVKHPETLRRRLKSKEPEKAQKLYVAILGILFLCAFILAGLDYRFRWSSMPRWVPAAALVIMCTGYALYGAVILQNAYASRVVTVESGQRVIDTGLYAIIRHPMYLACLLLFLAMPLALGSYVSAVLMLAFPVVLVRRIKNEEAVLLAELDGYAAYMKKTKYRLIPFVW